MPRLGELKEITDIEVECKVLIINHNLTAI